MDFDTSPQRKCIRCKKVPRPWFFNDEMFVSCRFYLKQSSREEIPIIATLPRAKAREDRLG